MFDFDKIIDRRNSGSLKWDVREGELPMWVADMDFETAPAVKRAIAKTAKLGAYGYKIVSDEWYSAIINWWKNRHDVAFESDWLCFCTGVVPAISCMVKRLSSVGDNVVTLTPVYNIFFNSILNAGRNVLECPLLYDGVGYSIDFNDLENKLKDQNTTLMILCNPHNPVGKIWDKKTLAKIGELCNRYGVKVIADEIHCDLTAPSKSYVPFISASETCKDVSVTCISASKAFNLAGMQSAAVVIPNENLRKIVVKGLNSDEVAEPNTFAIESTVAAFTKGGRWLNALRAYLFDNRKILVEYIANNLPALKVIEQEATYLVWVDVSKITDDSAKLCQHIRKQTGLIISDGSQYRGNGKSFVRINIACPKSVMLDGLKRLYLGIQSFNEQWAIRN